MTTKASNSASSTLLGCNDFRAQLADFILEPTYAQEHPEFELHAAACQPCRTERDELRATFAALDTWEAPEPSPYFDTRVQARLRDLQQQAPAGIWERLTAFFRYSSNATMRPVLASALAVFLVASGGTYAGIYGFHSSSVPTPRSAAVNDLQRLDNNAQTLQQMDALLDENNGDVTQATPTL